MLRLLAVLAVLGGALWLALRALLPRRRRLAAVAALLPLAAVAAIMYAVNND